MSTLTMAEELKTYGTVTPERQRYWCHACERWVGGWCPSGQRKHRQCPCCALCVRLDGDRRSCGGNQPEIKKRRHAHDAQVPMGPVNP